VPHLTPLRHLSHTPEDVVTVDVTLRVGVIWLLLITACVSIISDILVDTMGEFALAYRINAVFIASTVMPILSNIGEIVSAIIFAYRNKMNLCVEVTIGSTIQIGLFVFPSSVLYGWLVSCPMTIFCRGYESACLAMSVICVAIALQGKRSNWFIGFLFLGIYLIVATGFWYHDFEDLSVAAG